MREDIPEMMTAMVYRGRETLRIERVPVPRIGPNELLVKVGACGVCPTDIKKIYHGTVTPPRIFGHETAGVIADIGQAISQFRVGDRVALHHHVPCRQCHACRHHAFAQCPQYKKTGITAGFEPAGGGYAEYVRVMDFVLPGVVPLPEGSTLVQGAMLEPVNTVLKAVRKLGLLHGDQAIVVGQGPIGLLFTQILKLEGMRVVASDLIPERLDMAGRLGADATLRGDNPKWSEALRSRGAPKSVDAAIITIPSNEAVQQAMGFVREAGKVLLFGHTTRGEALPIDPASVCVDEKELLGSYSSDWTLQGEVAEIVFEKKIDVDALISHKLELADAPNGMALAAHPGGSSLKVMIVQDGGLTA